MCFSITRFAELRPYLYHLTAEANLDRIRSTRLLESAEELLLKAGRAHLLGLRRTAHLSIEVDGELVTLRDQAPLYEGNIQFEPGWNLGRLVAHLNRRVFFWPGRSSGPISYGVRHFDRYSFERPAVVRVSTSSVVRTNPRAIPLLCRFNSGSPRCSAGKRSPRGSATFVDPEHCGFAPGEVVEVTFEGSVVLPNGAELRAGNWSNWSPLFRGEHS